MTLHLERESTHQGVVISLANRTSGHYQEETVPFEEADEKWANYLTNGALMVAAHGPKLIRVNGAPSRKVRIEDDDD
jgi:hypothetical protein